jgi:hypothetical protein
MDYLIFELSPLSGLDDIYKQRHNILQPESLTVLRQKLERHIAVEPFIIRNSE